jgi:hypothetical protein
MSDDVEMSDLSNDTKKHNTKSRETIPLNGRYPKITEGLRILLMVRILVFFNLVELCGQEGGHPAQDEDIEADEAVHPIKYWPPLSVPFLKKRKTNLTGAFAFCTGAYHLRIYLEMAK